MCGVSGGFVWNASGNAQELPRAVARMNHTQACRGPDDEGTFADLPHGIALGHRRLSILDLSSAGHQPMTFGGRWWITFNGEIYNFLELRAELEAKGVRFTTRTDTEVILAAYATWGTDAFARMRGIFAFALWDADERRLLLVRDHYGVKPLYYWQGSSVMAFASTVRALAESGIVPSKEDPEALMGFLLCGAVPGPRTTLAGVREIPAGHFASWQSDGSCSVASYYRLTPVESGGTDRASAIAGTKQRFEEAVRLNMVSDAPLGVFLSGGLDSSAIAAIAAAHHPGQIKTLSIAFDEAAFSEREHQHAMARTINSDHHEAIVRRADFYEALPDIFAAMDQPTVDGVNTFFISRVAREAGLKVVLSGLGGDEVFCGYGHLRGAYLNPLRSRMLSLPLPWQALSRIAPRYGRLSHLRDHSVEARYLAVRGLFAPREVARVLEVSEESVWNFVGELRRSWREAMPVGPRPLANELSLLEFRGYLANQLLKDTDMMSMHHSIEARVPFLDYPLVEYVTGLSPELKIDAMLNKPLLAAAISDRVPRAIIERKKMGFTFPFAEWLRDLPSHLPLPPRTEAMHREFLRGRIHWSRVWAMVVLAHRRGAGGS